MANDLLRGRQTAAPLTNKSGGGVVAGDVVILGSATASSFITTTSAAQIADVVGVALETIADNATGRVCLVGYVPLINLASSASLGDYIRTHTVAKQAQRFATGGPGDFGQVLGTGTTPAAIIWGRPDQGAGTVSALDDLSDVVITGVASGEVLKYNGSNWVNDTDNTGGGGGAGDYILIEDRKAAGTNGGNFSIGAWQTRDLNTETADTGNHASVSSNQITLAAGTYRIRVRAPAYNVTRNMLRWRNITDSTTDVNGASHYFNGDHEGDAVLIGRFTIAGTKVFEVQHQCTVANVFGFGIAVGSGFTVTTEIYTQVELWKE